VLTIAGWPSAPWYLGCMRPGSSATLRISRCRAVVENERRKSKCLKEGIRDNEGKDRLEIEAEDDLILTLNNWLFQPQFQIPRH